MTKKPKRYDPAELAAAARFIEEYGGGSKAGAIRLIEAAEVQGSPGKPAEYPALDAQALFEVESLENEYRFRNRKAHRNRKAPSRWSLIKDLVSSRFSQSDWGKTEDAAARRISARGSLATMLFDWMSKHRPELLQHLPPDAEERVSSMDSHDLTAILGLGVFCASGFGEPREPRGLLMGPRDCVKIVLGLVPPSTEWSRS
jgi:hypothetical protein